MKRRVTIHDHLTGRAFVSDVECIEETHAAREQMVRAAFDEHFGFGPYEMLLWQPDGVNTLGTASGMKVTIERCAA